MPLYKLPIVPAMQGNAGGAAHHLHRRHGVTCVVLQGGVPLNYTTSLTASTSRMHAPQGLPAGSICMLLWGACNHRSTRFRLTTGSGPSTLTRHVTPVLRIYPCKYHMLGRQCMTSAKKAVMSSTKWSSGLGIWAGRQ